MGNNRREKIRNGRDKVSAEMSRAMHEKEKEKVKGSLLWQPREKVEINKQIKKEEEAAEEDKIKGI